MPCGAHLYFDHVNATLNLNGHDITVSADALKEGKAYANAVILVRYSNLDIVGEGNIIAENKGIAVYSWAHSNINIYSKPMHGSGMKAPYTSIIRM